MHRLIADLQYISNILYPVIRSKDRNVPAKVYDYYYLPTRVTIILLIFAFLIFKPKKNGLRYF